MRRPPIVLRAFFALVAVWLGVVVFPHGPPAVFIGTVGRAHGDAVALVPPHAAVRAVAVSRKASPSDAPSHLLPSSPGVPGWNGEAATPSAIQLSGIRGRASRTVTYDATAPPAIPNTVL